MRAASLTASPSSPLHQHGNSPEEVLLLFLSIPVHSSVNLSTLHQHDTCDSLALLCLRVATGLLKFVLVPNNLAYSANQNCAHFAPQLWLWCTMVPICLDITCLMQANGFAAPEASANEPAQSQSPRRQRPRRRLGPAKASSKIEMVVVCHCCRVCCLRITPGCSLALHIAWPRFHHCSHLECPARPSSD